MHTRFKAENGEVSEVHCTYEPSTRGVANFAGCRKVKSTITGYPHPIKGSGDPHVDRLFTKEDPEEGEEGFLACLNPNSLTIHTGFVEPHLAGKKPGDRFQFERQGYFCTDPDSTDAKPVFNLTVNLKDAWSKIEKKSK